MATIMLVTSDEAMQEQVSEALGQQDEWELLTSTEQDAKRDFEEKSIDVAVIGLPADLTAEDTIFAWIRDQHPAVPVVLLTADDSTEEATVEALVLGAASYVPQSLVASNLAVTVERILGLRGCRRRHIRLLDSLHLSKSVYKIEDNDLALVPVLVAHLADTAEEFDVCTNGKRLQFAIALEEALANGIVHGNLGIESSPDRHEEVIERRQMEEYKDKVLRVTAQFETGIAQVTIRDDGEGFEPSDVADPTQTVNLDKPHGRGLLLMQAFVDQVEFNEKGNEVCLTKRNPQRLAAPVREAVPAGV